MSAQSPWLLGPPQLQTQSRPSRASAAFLPQPANLSSSTGAAGQDGEAQPSAEVSNGSKVGGTDAEVSSGCRVEQAASQSSVNGIKVVLSGAEVSAVQPPGGATGNAGESSELQAPSAQICPTSPSAASRCDKDQTEADAAAEACELQGARMGQLQQVEIELDDNAALLSEMKTAGVPLCKP